MINYTKGELILSVKDVSLKFGDKQILHDISFDIFNIIRPDMIQGQIISICGRSGCGKTSLFNLLSGNIKPTSGTIKIDINQHLVGRGEMGLVPQDYPLFNHRIVYNNLLLALSTSGLSEKDKKDSIRQNAEYFELADHLDKYPCELSGGQKQRVSILQQVLAENRFILLDEPFSGLDCIMKDKVVDLLIKIANLNEYNTLIVVSHDIESSCAISDHVIVLGGNNNGNGSTILKNYDLLELDLAYHPNIKENPQFRKVINEIKSIM